MDFPQLFKLTFITTRLKKLLSQSPIVTVTST